MLRNVRQPIEQPYAAKSHTENTAKSAAQLHPVQSSKPRAVAEQAAADRRAAARPAAAGHRPAGRAPRQDRSAGQKTVQKWRHARAATPGRHRRLAHSGPA